MESSCRAFLPKLAAGEQWRVEKEEQIERMIGKAAQGLTSSLHEICSLFVSILVYIFESP